MQKRRSISIEANHFKTDSIYSQYQGSCIIANRFNRNAKTDYTELIKGLVHLSLDRLTSD